MPRRTPRKTPRRTPRKILRWTPRRILSMIQRRRPMVRRIIHKENSNLPQ